MPRYTERGMRQSGSHTYFADGGSGENGIRTNANFVYAASLLASEPDYDPSIGGISQSAILERAREVLRYLVNAHVTGEGHCADKNSWGGAWQSAWWTAKLSQGARLIWSHLSADEQAAVEQVAVFEANRHVGRVVPTGLSLDTKAEENAWDTEALATAWGLFPEHAQAPAWRTQLIEHGLNTLSVGADRVNEESVDGQRLCDAVYTENVYSDFTLDNHGSLHFCYIASPLASVAWSYNALRTGEQEIPQALFHHVREFYNASKSLFLGNRFAYIAGKDWARYTYGLYFIVPALVMFQEVFDDGDAKIMEAARFSALAEEQADNNDGSFFGKRVTKNRFSGQEAKYETDCYAMLGLAYKLRRAATKKVEASSAKALSQSVHRTKVSPGTLTCHANTPRAFASFSMRTLTSTCPTALYFPAGMEDVAEWARNQFFGQVRTRAEPRAVHVTQMKSVGAGFSAASSISYRDNSGALYRQDLAFSFDAESTVATVASKVTAVRDTWVLKCRGLNFHCVNDRNNGMVRNYYFDAGQLCSRFLDSAQKDDALSKLTRKIARVSDVGVQIDKTASSWLNIDDRMGIVQLGGRSGFSIRKSNERAASGVNWDLICTQEAPTRPFAVKTGEVILDSHFLLHCGTAEETQALAQTEPSA